MSTVCYSQNHSVGLRVEPFWFFSKTQGTGTFAYKHKDERGIYLTNFSLGYGYKLSETFSLSTRAGYLWTNEDRFNGFQINELIRTNISDKAFFITGLNIHFNKKDFIREFLIRKVTIPSLVLGTGFRLSEIFNVELQYLLPINNKEYKTSNFNGPVYYDLSGILKLSFGFEWQL